MPAIIVSTCSLYGWYKPRDYEKHLDERIHAILDAGADGVEISNGPSILTWRPRRNTVRRLRNKTVTIHAEILWGITLDEWAAAIQRLPFKIANTVFHPDELTPEQLPLLADLPFPASIENMDTTRDDWHTVKEMQHILYPGVGFTLDVAHAEENDLPVSHFKPLFIPAETHLSLASSPDPDYYDFDCAHALTHLDPGDFPHVPSGCPIVTIEGVVPPSVDTLATEVEFVRSKLL